MNQEFIQEFVLEELGKQWPHATLAQDLVASIYHAGEIAKHANRAATTKNDEGHRSIETAGDNDAQNDILRSLQLHTDLKFLCEEESSHPQMMPKKDPLRVFKDKTVFVDPVDGTSRYASHYPDWCTAGGIMENGVFTTSALYAPQSNGGVLIASHEDSALLLSEDGYPLHVVAPQVPRPPRKSIILCGVDTGLYNIGSSFMVDVAANVRATYSSGSGLFGLMSVALGRAAAIFQTPQKPWDWAPAYHAVTTTGNIFLFFRIVNGDLVPVDRFDYEAFVVDKENPQHRLGFIAGEPGIAQKLFDRLPPTGWMRKKEDPKFFG